MEQVWYRGVRRLLGVLVWVLACGCVLHGGTVAAPSSEIGLYSVCWDEYEQKVEVRCQPSFRLVGGDWERFVSVEPAVSNLRITASWGSRSLLVDGDWLAETTYLIRVKKGLTFEGGRVLAGDGALRVRIPRLSPALSLLSKGIFYPLNRKELVLPLVVRNVGQLSVKPRVLSAANLVPYSLSESRLADSGVCLPEKEYQVPGSDNCQEELELDLSGVLPVGKPGLYMLDIRGKDLRSEEGDTVWQEHKFLVVTDLALAVCQDAIGRQLLVSVRRLSDNRPVPEATVSVSSRKNMSVSVGKTNRDGLCRIAYDSRFTQDNEPRMVIVSQGADTSFLEVSPHYRGYRVSQWNAEDFSSSGKLLEPGPQAFVYWERGAMRPGETAHVSAFLRQREPKCLPVLKDFPCVWEIWDPAGNVVATQKTKTDGQGYVDMAFKAAGNAPTGRYEAVCRIDGGRTLGAATILVATYVPDRLNIQVSTDRNIVHPGERFVGTCRANYYYGEPARDSKGFLQVLSMGAFMPDHWRDYAVGGVQEKHAKLGSDKVAFPRLGDSQKLTYEVPPDFRASLPWDLRFQGTVLEAGGRGVSRNCRVILDPCGWYLGMKQAEMTDGQDLLVDYKVLGLEPGRTPVVRPEPVAELQLYRITWDYVQIKEGTSIRYGWNRFRQQHGKAWKMPVRGTAGTFRFPKIEEGHYEVECRLGEQRATLLECWHYYGEGGQRTADPHQLTFTTDRADYEPGDTAKVSFEAPGNGYGILVHGESGLDEALTLEVREGANVFPVAIPQWLPTGGYTAALTVVCGTDPHVRLFGMVRLKVKQDRHRLQVKLEAPAEARPEQPLNVKVSLSDWQGKPVAGIAHLFLVDCGVLSLTDFKTPDIHGFFHGAKDCRMTFWDLYGDIYPDLKLKGVRRIGGDGISGRLRRKFGESQEEQSAVVYMAPVVTDASGQAQVSVTLPKHQGAMRIMCVASSPDSVGQGDRQVIVRDQIGVAGTCPRAVVPGDEFDCVFTLNNFDLPDGNYAFEVKLPAALKPVGPVSFKGELRQGAPVIHSVRALAFEQLGKATIDCVLTMGTVRKQETMTVQVRGANPPVTLSETRVIPPGGKSDFDLNSQTWLVGTVQGGVEVSAFPVTSLADGLAWLNAYPYGCLEQTVACVLPFLRLDQLAAAGLVSPEEVETCRTKIRLAMDAIMSVYLGNGTFALWPGARKANLDASLFAANFIAALNRQIPQEKTLLQALRGKLARLAENAAEPYRRGYACYVLSLLDGEERRGDSAGTVAALNILASGKETMDALLASAALIQGGRAAEGMPMFKRCLAAGVWRRDYGNYAYDDEASRLGMALHLVMDIMPREPLADQLAHALAQKARKDGLGWGTTQANAWAVLGLTGYLAHRQQGEARARLVKRDGSVSPLELKGMANWKMKQGEGVTLENTGDATLYATFTREGVPRGMLPQTTGALTIQRTYLNQAGQPITSARQGELVQVRIEVESLCNVSELVIVDLLPGGLEIEDDRLATRALAYNDREREHEKGGWLRPTFVERRDDRLVLFADFLSSGKGSYVYQARAVSRGRFGVPPVSVEAMYAPELRATGVDMRPLEIK